MRLTLVSAAVLSLAVGATFAPRAAARHDTGFLDRSVTVKGQSYKYEVYVPQNWASQKQWPIILFLHGSGERGSDGIVQTEVGIGSAIRRDATRFPAVVVLAQCPKDQWWSDPEMEDIALAELKASAKEFHGDPKRTYLTGLSMGGFGSWSIVARFPGRFAAVVPICGDIQPSKRQIEHHPELANLWPTNQPDPYAAEAAKIGKTPIWIFHGEKDDTVPPDGSRKMFEALKAAGGNVKYTEYPGVGHNSWDKAYAETELTTWLFAQHL